MVEEQQPGASAPIDCFAPPPAPGRARRLGCVGSDEDGGAASSGGRAAERLRRRAARPATCSERDVHRTVFRGRPRRASCAGRWHAVGNLFTDGQIVQKGDPLFVIDSRPFEIKLQQAIAAVQSARARLELKKVELARAQRLKETTFGTAETVDQRQADEDAATAALATAQQSVLDARLDLEFAHISTPFTGRMSREGEHVALTGGLLL